MATRATSRRAVPDQRDAPTLSEPDFALDEAKLHPPPLPRGTVHRGEIVRQVDAAGASVLAVVAPAGYGKSTFLAQWAERKAPRVAWLAADARDNDPTMLLPHLAAALHRIEAVESMTFRPPVTPGSATGDVIRVAAAIAGMTEPIALVLDNAEAITNSESRDIVAGLALRLPPGSHLAIGSRDPAPVPMARLRANRSLVEVGSDQLAMERAEARALLRGAGVDLTESAIETLVEHTEGWPVGLYLAALAMKAGSREVGVERTFTGDDRFMGDYLRTEILDRVSRTDATFLARTSILERLCGPLCDATVATKGSGRLLDRLARDNKLVIPLDRRGEWYRYHHLFRDLLRAELERREPETISELHGRAARWYQEHGYPEAAIDHAQLAADVDRVAELVLQVANPVWSSGRLETVLRWMEWFPANGRIEEHPAIALHGALIHALIGRAGDAERWANAAHRTTFDGVLSDGNSMAGSLAYLRALMCRDGFDTMSRDADAALQGLSPTSPYRAAMLHALGVAHLARLDLDAADRCFVSALDEARSAGIVPFIPVLLTERGIVACERGHGAEAEALARDALAMMTGGRYDDYWTSALVYAWCGHLAAQRGDLEDGRRLAADAARLRPLLTYALPVVSVQALLELARAYLALADSGGARAALRQVRDILARCPDLGSFPASAHHLQATVETLRDDIVGASSLTAAEFRLVPLLSTHLTYPEIGERLFISRHTVKSQAGSVYRKLGVASRSEAIARLQQLGLAPVQDVAGGPLA